MAKKAVRPPRPVRAAGGGVPRLVKFVGALLLLLVASHCSLIQQVEDVGDAIVRPLNAYTAASFRGGYYTWDGDLGLRRLRIESPDGRSYIAVEGLELDTPSWWWTLQLVNPYRKRTNMLSEGLGLDSGSAIFGAGSLPSADELHIRMRGFELELNSMLPPGTPSMNFTSGAPFETEGCTSVRYFVPLNLGQDLRLTYTKTDLSIGYHLDGPDKVVLEGELDAPGVMTTRFEADIKTPDSSAFVNERGKDEGELVAMRWTMADHGFVEARNRWCAEQAEIDTDEFQRRHITTVRRVLEVYGVRMTPETEAVYSSFARSGGTLLIESKPSSSVNNKLFASYSPEQRWLTLNVRIQHDQSPAVPMTLEFIPPRRLPSAYAGSVWDLIARNADQTPDGQQSSPFADMGANMRSMAQPAAAAAAPAAPAAPISVAAPTPEPVKAVGPLLLALDTASLEAAIGKRVQVETEDGNRRVGELIAVDKKTITIRMQVSGGKADLAFSRERLSKVEAERRGSR